MVWDNRNEGLAFGEEGSSAEVVEGATKMRPDVPTTQYHLQSGESRGLYANGKLASEREGSIEMKNC